MPSPYFLAAGGPNASAGAALAASVAAWAFIAIAALAAFFAVADRPELAALALALPVS